MAYSCSFLKMAIMDYQKSFLGIRVKPSSWSGPPCLTSDMRMEWNEDQLWELLALKTQTHKKVAPNKVRRPGQDDWSDWK